ncbi:MAG: glucan 1,4-alpha-maltotetraohydrolase domain-containing protein [Cystobacter sp.]
MLEKKTARGTLSWWCALALLGAPAAFAGPMDGNSEDVMLQGFHWTSYQTSPWWGIVQGKAADIGASGFSMVWLPPSSDAASNEGYLPRQLRVLNSRYGSEAQLRSALGALRSAGVKPLADIVINHRVGTTNWADFTNPTWGPSAVVRGDEWAGATGNADTGEGYDAARDLDHTNATVRADIKSWMSWLKSVGYDGWRYDYVKGFSGAYVNEYNVSTAPYFSVGELWTDLNLDNPNPHRQQLMNWLDATRSQSTVFDFTTKGLLQQAVQYNQLWRMRDAEGKPAGAIGWWPARSVTFIDNHDTGPSTSGVSQNHWPFPSDKVMQGYAYILTHPGIPCVYWVHFYDWGLKDSIKTLMSIRKAKGIHSSSAVSIQVADAGRYAALITGTRGSVAMKIGPDAWSPGTGWKLETSGSNYAVWSK